MRRVLASLLAAAFLLTACGDGDGDDDDSTTTTEAGAGTTTTAGTAGDTTTTTAGAQPSTPTQPVLWPAVDVVVDDPVEAGRTFLVEFLGTAEPVLGEFQQGDASSGELPVFGRNEGGGQGPLRSTLLLRRFGDGWWVIAAVSEAVTIESPEALATVPAGPVTVEGRGRGFEATLLVFAYAAGVADGEPLDMELGAGGALEALEPYSVELDLGGATSGGTVALVVANESPLDGDLGDIAALPVVIG